MKPFRRLCLGALGLTVSVFAQASVPLTHIVSDDAALIVAVHDVPKVLAEWENSPWSKTWNDEQVKRFFAPLRAQIDASDWTSKLKEKTGYTVSELLGFATGDAVVVLNDLQFASETPAHTPPVLIAIDVGSNGSKLEGILVKAAKNENALEETSEFSGVVVHTLQPDSKKDEAGSTPTIWAIVDEKLILSPSRDALVGAIDALKNGSLHNPWDSSERFAKMQQRSGGESQFVFSVNATALYPTLKSWVVARAKANPQNNPLNLDPEALLTALGLDAIREFYVTARLQEEGTETHSALTYSETKGLIKFLAYRDGPPATPDFVSAKWNSVSTARFSLKDAFSSIEEMLESFSPPLAGLYQGQVRAFNKQLGIDIKRDFFGSMGDAILVANAGPTDAPADVAPAASELEQVFAISLEDTDAFSKSIVALRNSFGPNADTLFKSRDYLGQKITSVDLPSAPGAAKARGIHYSITKGWFLLSVGSAGSLETALQTLASKQPTLWEKPEIKAALARMPGRAGTFSYQDMRVLVGTFFRSLASASSAFGPKAAPAAQPENADAEPQKLEKPKVAVDPSAIPDLSVISKYWDHSVNYSERDSSGIYVTAQIVYPK